MHIPQLCHLSPPGGMPTLPARACRSRSEAARHICSEAREKREKEEPSPGLSQGERKGIDRYLPVKR